MARTRSFRRYYTKEELRSLRRARPSDPPTKYEFQVAMERVDLATMVEYMALDSVRREIEETNAYIARHGCEPPRVQGREVNVFPWYWMHRQDSQYHPQKLFTLAAWKRSYEVIEWFFADERAAFMGETLAYVLPGLLQQAPMAKWAPAVELVLSSVVFSQYLTPTQQQQALDNSLSMATSEDVVSVLVSHGASIQAWSSWSSATPPEIDSIVKHGRIVVGANLPEDEEQDIPRHTQHLLRLGTTFKPSALMLASTFEWPDAVSSLISEGFADVDARDHNGRTALIAVAARSQCGSNVSAHEEIVRILLQGGADPRLHDSKGETTLSHAVASSNLILVNLLLTHLVEKYGTEAVHGDESAMTRAWDVFRIHMSEKRRNDATQILIELLTHGACPFTTNPSACRLKFMESKEGREIIASNARLFKSCDRCSSHAEPAQRRKKRRTEES